MLPSLYRHRKPQLEGAKLELLYSIIAEKLLAQEALARKFDQDSVVQMAFGEVSGLLARDELYRQEVSNKVIVTPAEIEHGIIMAQLQVLVAFIFFEREEDASFVRVQMRGGKDFERIAIDSSMQALRDTATVIWSDADPVIEEAAYKLKLGEVSPVVAAGNGFYILKQLAVQTNGFYASMQPDVLRERVTTKIRERKEQIRASEFVEEVLKHKVGRSLSEPFKLLAKSLMDMYKSHARDSLISLNSNSVMELKTRLTHALSDTLVEVGNSRWTVDDVINRLLSTRFTVSSREIRTIPARLNSAIKLMVHQELLGEEALARGLDKVPAVRRQLEMWHNAYLADMLKEHLRQTVRVTDSEVFGYLKSKDPKTPIPLVQIRELQTNSITEMNQALTDLEQGMSLEDAIEKWSNDPASKARKGISSLFPVTDRLPIGEIASQMKIGERYGPVRVPNGVLYFELVARQPATDQPADTALAAQKMSAREELMRMKQKRKLDLYLAQIGQERGFMVYEDRLKKIEVSPIPMMTFRLLGFGGRMFAVPFVQKQLDWLDIDPPTEKILP
jgi:hypothetical protein